MTFYTDNLSAEQLIRHIAKDYLELSQEKIRDQRDYYYIICRNWLTVNRGEPCEQSRAFNDDF
jgi:hypothetical protein